MEEIIKEQNETAATVTASSEKKPGFLSKLLNKYFHHLDRGGSLKNEVTSGILVGVLAVCAIFMNMQVISQTLVKDGMSNSDIANIYAGTYFVSTLIACIGSLLVGVITRLPLVQSAGLGIGALFVSTVGAYNGLSYYNLLSVSFVSSVVYAVLVSVPVVKRFVFEAIPKSVLKALPAAAGALVCFLALQLSGIIVVGENGISINQFSEIKNASGAATGGFLASAGDYSGDVYKPYVVLGLISAVVAIIGFIVFNGIKKRSRKHCQNPLWLALLLGTVFFFVAAAITCFSQITNWGRLWLVGGQDAYMNHVLSGAMTLNIGKVFTEGFDFTAFTAGGGNVATLFVGGVLTYLFIGLFDAQSTLEAVACDVSDAEYKKVENFSYNNARELATICNAGVNIFASVLGVPPVTLSKESVASSKNGAKSGISSIVASLVLCLSIFVWVIPFLFATYTATAGIATTSMYGHIGSGALAATSHAAFCVVDAIMAITGVTMVAGAMKNFDFSSYEDAITFTLVMLVTLFTSNIAYGALSGVIAYCLMNLMQIKKSEDKKNAFLEKCGIPTIVLTVLGVVILVFSL